MLATARGMIEGRVPLVEGCRTLVRLRCQAELGPNSALQAIAGIESETDDYPIGTVRVEYAAELLARLDAEISNYLEKVRPVALSACREIIKELENAG